MVANADLFGQSAEARTPPGSIPRWAERYGYGIRQIKNWLALGRKEGEMPPFDDPEKLGPWCEKHLGKIPKRLAGRLEAELRGESVAPAEEASPPETFEIPEVDAGGLGIEQQLENYRREFLVLTKLRHESLEKGEFTRADRYLEQQQKVSAEIRQLEKLLPTILEQRGDLRPSSEVRRTTTEALKVLRQVLFGRGGKSAHRFLGLRSEAEVKQLWGEEIGAAFRDACESGFQETLTLEA